MRLLRCTGDSRDNAAPPLEEFYGNVPKYAILSHRWGKSEDEVSFEDIRSGSAVSHKHGYTKVMGACVQARSAGIDYVWIDTCCIDKSSSAELSEAINSMFAWYKNAAVCFAYLEDVVDERLADPLGGKSLFRSSEWFARGWTLQELISPSDVMFYNKTWDVIGSRSGMASLISEITGIHINVLRKHPDEIVTASVAQRMSWAAGRRTTREEDRVYSLMGLFDVNMPPLYGEGGERAFLRLQEEIMRRSTDHSLFAWSGDWKGAMSGLLARSVDFFANSADIVPIDYNEYAAKFNITQPNPEFLQTNFGTRIQLPLELVHATYEFRAHLACISRFSSFRQTISIPLILFPGAGIENYERIDYGALDFNSDVPNKADIVIKDIYVTSFPRGGIFESRTIVIELVFTVNDPDDLFTNGDYRFQYCTGPSIREGILMFSVLFPKDAEDSFVIIRNMTDLQYQKIAWQIIHPQVFFIVGIYQGQIWTHIHHAKTTSGRLSADEARSNYLNAEDPPEKVRKLHRRSTSFEVGGICHKIDVSDKHHPSPSFRSYLAMMSFTKSETNPTYSGISPEDDRRI